MDGGQKTEHGPIAIEIEIEIGIRIGTGIDIDLYPPRLPKGARSKGKKAVGKRREPEMRLASRAGHCQEKPYKPPSRQHRQPEKEKKPGLRLKR